MTYMVGKPTKNDLVMVSLPPIFVQRPQAVRDSRTLMVVGSTINIPQMLISIYTSTMDPMGYGDRGGWWHWHFHSKAHRRARGARQTQDGSAREHRES